jgi:hypothetical protein
MDTCGGGRVGGGDEGQRETVAYSTSNVRPQSRLPDLQMRAPTFLSIHTLSFPDVQ